MEKQAVIDALEKAKKQLTVAKEDDEKSFAKGKVEKLQAELDQIMADEAKALAMSEMGKSKKKKPACPAKVNGWLVFTKENQPAYKEKYGSHKEAMKFMAIDYKKANGTYVEPEKPKAAEPEKKKEIETGRMISKKHKLIKISDDVYTVENTETKVKELEIEKRKDGKFHVTCITKEKLQFDTLEAAIDHVEKVIYKSEVKARVGKSKKTLVAAKKWKENHPTGKTTPTEDVKTDVEKV